MPMKTMLLIDSPSASSCRARQSWSIISAVSRLRVKPSLPVAQNEQSSGHPTCVETQSVRRCSSGMRTASTIAPSAARSASFRVPSRDSATPGDVERSSPPSPRQPRAQRGREIGHRLEVLDASAVHPSGDLVRSEGLDPVAPEALAQLADREVLEVCAAVHHSVGRDLCSSPTSVAEEV